ncbi:DUF6488 family protein [Sulfurimonas sp.]
MKTLIILLTLNFTILYASDANNHNCNGHNHKYEVLKNEISKQSVKEIAKAEVIRLSLEKKIPKSWKNMPVSKIGKTHYGDTNDWKVGFNNLKIKNKTKQTLYIFVSVQGKVLGANYTGN